MRQILRYTEAIQKALGCKTKPEPWMHIGIKTPSKRLPFAGWAIWVWDTRDVLEDDIRIGDYATNAFCNKCDAAMKLGPRAVDNHQPLKGAKDIADGIGLNQVMELGDKPAPTAKTGQWQRLCELAKADPATTKELWYCMANNFQHYVGGRPGESGYTGRTEPGLLGHYVIIKKDMDDKQIKDLMRKSKAGTVGYAGRMAARYHGNPSCGKRGEYVEIVSTIPVRGDFVPAR